LFASLWLYLRPAFLIQNIAETWPRRKPVGRKGAEDQKSRGAEEQRSGIMVNL
jgi:hypothetical protein